jgi:5-methylcytosine-specific restriction endonuclease McrA
MYFLTEPIETYQPLYEFEGYLHERYQGFTRIADARLEEIEDDFRSVEELIKEILEYEGEGLPDRLELGPSRSRKIAEESLQIDDIKHGTVDEKTVPDSEGRKRIGLHVSHERSPKNREKAIEIHGTSCEVCEFDFDKTYGPEHAGGYIQIHHITPLSGYEGEVDPETDLVPLCANCHVMAHRRKTVTTVNELKALIEKAKG